MNHLSFEVLANALAEGFIPDTLSTDVTDAFLDTADYSLATLATYLLAFGVPLHEVVARMTVRPAAVVGRHRPSEIATGGAADLTLLAVRDVQGVLRDVDGREVMATQVISPVATVRAGTYRPCRSRGR
jgi:dihydroorotase